MKDEINPPAMEHKNDLIHMNRPTVWKRSLFLLNVAAFAANSFDNQDFAATSTSRVGDCRINIQARAAGSRLSFCSRQLK